MAHFDLSVPELERFAPDLDEPADLRQFWNSTLEEAREHELDVALTEVENHQRALAEQTRAEGYRLMEVTERQAIGTAAQCRRAAIRAFPRCALYPGSSTVSLTSVSSQTSQSASSRRLR